MGRVENKVALVTGAARGMGAAFARRLVEEGARVVVTDIIDDQGEELVAELGENAIYRRLDVTDPQRWTQVVADTLSAFGRLDILVNNAGIADFAPFEDFTLAQWDRTLAVNLSSAFYGTKAATEALIASGAGSVINVSSTAGIEGKVERAAYNAAKFGIRGLTKNIALDLGRYNVRANAILPGLIKTPMAEGDDFSQHDVALHRAAEPFEVANLVLFLASDESAFITGADYAIDGGETAGKVFYSN